MVSKPGIRPEGTPQQVISRHDQRTGQQNAPIPVKCQQREGSQHVEVRFYTAVREMNEQCKGQHLRDRHSMAGQRLAWPFPDQQQWNE
jgi:hypothetical protein